MQAVWLVYRPLKLQKSKSNMEKKLKVVVAGCGGMSRTWFGVAAEMDSIDIVGLVDIREQSALERAQEFGLEDAIVGTDLKVVLDTSAPDIVFDCTVPETHVHITLEALRHGCHVLGEKPMADSMENAREMFAAAQNAGKLYAVIQNRRYDPQIRRLRHFLAEGEIGQITTLNSDYYMGPHFGGFRDRMEHSLLLDMAIHTFDAARFITREDPVSVYCKEWNPLGSWYDHGASAIAVFEMTGGVVYTYRGSWCSEGLRTSWNSDWNIVGSNGSIKWDGEDEFSGRAKATIGESHSEWEGLEVPVREPTARIGGHAGLIHEFVDCVQKGNTPETVCTDNIKSLAMVFGAIESAKSGKPVAISP